MQVVERRQEQAAEESSGFNHTFPPGGNDHQETAFRFSESRRTIQHPGIAFPGFQLSLE